MKQNQIEYFIKDAKNLLEITRTYSDINPDVIIHLAAVSHANKSNKDPHTTFENSFPNFRSNT